MTTLTFSEAGPMQPGPVGEQTYWWEAPELVCVPWVDTFGSKPQSFIKWLGELESKGKPVAFLTVINARLALLLIKRGYGPAAVWFPDIGEPVECLLKEANP